MTIGVLFSFGDETIEVRIVRANVYFRSSGYGSGFVTIEGLKLNYDGVINEFPDLVDSPTWETEARERFKQKIKEFKTETECSNYIIEDLKQHGYTALFRQRSGFRPGKI